MGPNVNVDLMSPDGGQGELAARMGNGGLNIGQMRPFIDKKGRSCVTVYQGGDTSNANSWKTLQANAKGTLRRDEWKALDETLLTIKEQRLTGTQHLINSGLTYTLGNAMGTTVLEYHDSGDSLTAELSMDAVSRAENDRQEFSSVYLPIPIIHVDYSINQRGLEASRRLGNPLDVSQAERAGRRVMEKQESMLFADQSYKFGGGTIYSFLNFPSRIPNTILDWSDTANTGKDIIDDVLEMKQAAIDKFFYGPYTVFIPTNFETRLDQDYADAKGDNTIRERILKINNIDDIIVVDELPDSEVVMVQKTTDVVRIVQGLAMQNIQWSSEGGFVNKFKVISIQVPQLRADQNGNTGIVHGTTT
jgi:uncharacterized linocin/CFP29 family protein